MSAGSSVGARVPLWLMIDAEETSHARKGAYENSIFCCIDYKTKIALKNKIYINKFLIAWFSDSEKLSKIYEICIQYYREIEKNLLLFAYFSRLMYSFF